ncbi:methylmalonyl-CoA mutase family protein [Spirosoma fluminis]
MEPLFKNIFSPVDRFAWLAQVRAELKDEHAYESLRWSSPEGFGVEPYYTADDLTTLPLADIQTAQKAAPGWLNAPERRITNEKLDNASFRSALTSGADALVLDLPLQVDVNRLLDGIKLSDTPVYFRLASAEVDFVQALQTVAPYQLKGGLLTDVSADTAQITRQLAGSPQFRTVCVNSHPFHNAGATATQELAFTFARLSDAYDQLTEAGLTAEELAPKTLISVSVGTSYFMEIAKLRALRVLWQRFIGAYGTSTVSVTVHAQTSTFYDATATPYTNLLRATTEAMAAVMGGCDVLTIHPYDTVLGHATDELESNFSERIARNVSLLLAEESYLGKVADPAAGSYYIETLTSQLITAAWTLFLDVEKQGGYTKAMENGFIPGEIDKSYRAKIQAVETGKVLVGVNKFRFDEGNRPATHPKGRSQSKTGLPDRRLGESFE